jgi:hypothetical protein
MSDNEQKNAKIREALQQLDPANNEHWTDNGLPREGAVRQLTDDQNISRRDIQTARPGFLRPTDAVEAERREIVSAVVSAMEGEGLLLSHRTVAKRIDAKFPGFAYSDELDNYTDHVTTGMVEVESEDDAPEAVRQRLELLQRHAGELRALIYTLTNQRTKARENVGHQLASLNAGRPRVTQQMLIRENLARSLAQRQAIHDGRAAPAKRRPGRSAVDLAAAFSHGGTAADFARKTARGEGFRRGSYPASARGGRARG